MYISATVFENGGHNLFIITTLPVKGDFRDQKRGEIQARGVGMTNKDRPAGEITKGLRDGSIHARDEAADALLKLVYTELHRQAHRYLQRERVGHTLQTTALVHEAYLRLVEQKSVAWESRSHFFAIAATMMRRILIDYAKTKHRLRRGGVQSDLPLENALTIRAGETDFDLVALDEALNRLAGKEEQLAKVVELRFFSGLDVVETANVLGVSESTVKRDWRMAKAWLHRELKR
ncbi:MAG TPA: sigma-70 family RNA polymerase sigma factor [Pyrinomonadaceae bacterium]|nr:sigma-70 family RNA polymerase sigma factor [Pyrinomonadaceae bacterium]